MNFFMNKNMIFLWIKNLLWAGDCWVGVDELFVALLSLGDCPVLNTDAIVFASGGGIGYIPIAISTRESPKDQMSLWTE